MEQKPLILGKKQTMFVPIMKEEIRKLYIQKSTNYQRKISLKNQVKEGQIFFFNSKWEIQLGGRG